jgi:Flp pilus assembly protein TadG
MIKQRRTRSRQDGFALMYMAATLTLLCLVTGLAVDSGRAYVVKAQLTKAVDGAALAAARNLNTGNPRDEAARIFSANFPTGYFGTSSVTPTSAPSFFENHVVDATGVNVVTVTASAVLPTTFMRLANYNEVTVTSTGEAQRRMVDLSLVLDVSSSIGAAWPAVAQASRAFVNSFDQNQDRLALLFFGNGAEVVDAMPSGRGFDKPGMIGDIPNTLPNGSTNMVEGLYRGWDELRNVPLASRSGLRVIVLFTDGASNSVPANWDGTGVAKAVRTYDFPHVAGETAGQTHDQPHTTGPYDTKDVDGSPLNPPGAIDTWYDWNTRWTTVRPPDSSHGGTGTGIPAFAQWMPSTSLHNTHKSSGIPTSFPLLDNTLMVDGSAQSSRRPLRDVTAGKYPSQVFNINNAARNLVEIIANAARAETEPPSARVRIYTIGMGALVKMNLGTRPETSESILKRIANDTVANGNPDFNSAQLQGAYYYAETAADVGAAFQALQNQIVRLSK